MVQASRRKPVSLPTLTASLPCRAGRQEAQPGGGPEPRGDQPRADDSAPRGTCASVRAAGRRAVQPMQQRALLCHGARRCTRACPARGELPSSRGQAAVHTPDRTQACGRVLPISPRTPALQVAQAAGGAASAFAVDAALPASWTRCGGRITVCCMLHAACPSAAWCSAGGPVNTWARCLPS